MMPSRHIAASAVTSVAFLAVTKSWPGALACFASGILIDLDHLLDFYIRRKKMCWDINELHDFCSNDMTGRLYLIFHSYELVIFLWWLVFYLNASLVWLGFVFGLIAHLLLDQIFNPVYPWAYFMFYRLKLGFPKKVFFRDEFLKDYNRIKQ